MPAAIPAGAATNTLQVVSTAGVQVDDIYFAINIGCIIVVGAVTPTTFSYQKLQIDGDLLVGNIPANTTFNRISQGSNSPGIAAQPALLYKMRHTFGAGAYVEAIPGTTVTSDAKVTYGGPGAPTNFAIAGILAVQKNGAPYAETVTVRSSNAADTNGFYLEISR